MIFIFVLHKLFMDINHFTISYTYAVYCTRMLFLQYCDDLTKRQTGNRKYYCNFHAEVTRCNPCKTGSHFTRTDDKTPRCPGRKKSQ